MLVTYSIALSVLKDLTHFHAFSLWHSAPIKTEFGRNQHKQRHYLVFVRNEGGVGFHLYGQNRI